MPNYELVVPTRLFTTYGTVLFVDTVSGELKHGPIPRSPANVALVFDSKRWRLAYHADGALRPIRASAEGCYVTDTVSAGDVVEPATAFELHRIGLYERWIGFKADGKFLSADPGGRLALVASWWRAWESFLLYEPLPEPHGAGTRKRPSLGISCIETRDITGAVQAVERTVQCIKPDCIYWFSNQPFPQRYPSVEIIHIETPQFTDFHEDINRLCLQVIPRVASTDFILTVQSDGFAVNPQSWDDRFWDYDYIGGAWPASYLYGPVPLVGNGGFSLRSRKLLNALIDLNVKWRVEDWADDPRIHESAHFTTAIDGTRWLAEDVLISIWYRNSLERQRGIKFCPPELANKFSVSDITHSSTEYWLARSFGFHGRNLALHYGVFL